MTRLTTLDRQVLTYAASDPCTPLFLAWAMACQSGEILSGWRRLHTMIVVFWLTLTSIDRLKKAGLLKEVVDEEAMQATAADSRADTGMPHVPTVLTITPAGALRLAV